MEVKFGYGVLMPPLKEQAEEQGLELKNVEFLESLRKAVNLCKFHVLTDKQGESAVKKLHKEVMKNVKFKGE